MRIDLFTFSEGTAIDAEHRGYSIFNIIVDIVPAALPLFIPKAVLSLIVKRTKNEPDVVEGTLSVFNNDDPIQEDIDVKIDFDGRLVKILRLTLNGLPVQAPGVLAFKYQSEEINETLEVIVGKPPVSSEID